MQCKEYIHSSTFIKKRQLIYEGYNKINLLIYAGYNKINLLIYEGYDKTSTYKI